MKSKSLKEGDYAGTGLMLLGLFAGALGGNALITIGHDPASTNAMIKDYLPVKRVLLGAGAGFGASLVDGKDAFSTITRGVGYGVALSQALGLTQDVAGPKIPVTGTKANRIARGALGLNCPADPSVQKWGMGRTKARRKGRLGFVIPENVGQKEVVFAGSENVQI